MGIIGDSGYSSNRHQLAHQPCSGLAANDDYNAEGLLDHRVVVSPQPRDICCVKFLKTRVTQGIIYKAPYALCVLPCVRPGVTIAIEVDLNAKLAGPTQPITRIEANPKWLG